MAADFTSITEREREILRFVYCQHSHRTSFGGVKYNAEANAVNKTVVRDGVLIDSMIPKDVNGSSKYTQAEVDDLVTKGYLTKGAGQGEGGGDIYSLANDGRLVLGQLGDRHPY